MKDDNCVGFLQWALPRLDMRWEGFRKVRNQVCKRIDRRMQELDLSDSDAYRRFLEAEAEEWARLDEFCRVTISRFYRDRGVFDKIAFEILPDLANTSEPVRCWSAGCASGEEPYTLAMCGSLTENRHIASSPQVRLQILATDADEHMLERARTGCYQRGTLKELPDTMVRDAFIRTDREEPLCLRDVFRHPVTFRQHDVREDPPGDEFDLILCRNLVFTYFDEALQRKCLDRFTSVLRPGGALVIGAHEALPGGDTLAPSHPNDGIYRRVN